jgi:hypothetical protein
MQSNKINLAIWQIIVKFVPQFVREALNNIILFGFISKIVVRDLLKLNVAQGED